MADPRKDGQIIRLSLPSSLDLLGVVDKVADGITELLEFDDVDRDAVAISVIEACTNAIQHGHQSESSREIQITFEIEPDRLAIVIHDGGGGFQPSMEDDPTPPDLLATRGRGIFIMRTMMDEVDFDFSDGTTARLVKHKRKPEKEPKGRTA